MKRVRCPKCDSYIIFDETKYAEGQSLVFQCEQCGKQFGIRIKAKLPDKPKASQSGETEEEEETREQMGTLLVIENAFCYKQELPIYMGDNIIGRYQKGQNIQCPIESSDPSMDMHHCVINVQRNKRGQVKYILRDGPSYTGTFVSNEILADNERRVIEHGTLFTIGATSLILKTKEDDD